MDVVTGRYIRGAKVVAKDFVTDETFASVIKDGLPYFKSLPWKYYTFSVTAPGYKRTVRQKSAACDEVFPGDDVVTHSVYMWKGSTRQTVNMDDVAFKRPPYKGRYGVKMIRGVEFLDQDEPASASNQPRIVIGVRDDEVAATAPAVSEPAVAKSETKAEEAAAKVEEPTPQPAKPRIISGGVLNGKAIVLRKPVYPPAAEAVKASGAVSVQVLVDEEGNVVSASAVSGNPLLRGAAVEAARKAKFPPTLLSGQPVKVSGIITYNFTP